MVLAILIAFISLIGLIILHEFGHFILAKKFGVKVEEFGIGYPPRLFGKKIGETLYSLNLLPFGAFVKIYGEEGGIEDYRSFSGKPIWKRVLIVLGGVVSFWIIAAVILSIIAGTWGLPTAVEDEENHILRDPKVQITFVVPNSPAEKAELKIGDVIQGLEIEKVKLKTTKVKEVIEFINTNRGKEMTITIKRGKEIVEKSLIPRVSPPEGEGPLGVALARIAFKPYPWYEAPIKGIYVTGRTTFSVIVSLIDIMSKVIRGVPLPPGTIELKGPVGIVGEIIIPALERGAVDYLWIMAMISIFVALFNTLPIPALDGGKLLFLAIEGICKKPIPQRIEKRINAFFFTLLIFLMIFVTIKDIAKLF